ncbi:MAG: PPC domain-containing protein, partial [bacterium]
MQFRRSAPLLGLILSLVISVVPAPAQKLGQKVSKSTKTATEKSADKSGVMRQTRGFAPSGAICASNAPISPGQTINGALATSDCQLSDGSYFDEYTFTANAGQQVWISMSSASFDTYMVLVNPDNTDVQDDDGGGGSNSRIPAGMGFIALPQTGTYSILANSFAPNTTGPYSVTLTFGSGGGTVCPPTPTPIASGQTLNGTLSATDCVLQDNTAYDSFSFTANAGQQVAITMTSTSQVDPYLFLVAPDGSTIGEDDNGGGGTSARIPPIAGTFGSLPATGTYIIFANTLQPTQFGNYSVTLNFSGSSCAAAPISIGQTISGALAATDCRLPGDGSFFDSYTFNGTAGQQIAIAMTSTSFDDFLILLSPTGSVIATDDNSGGGTNARIPGATGALTLPSTGTYTILANSSLPN